VPLATKQSLKIVVYNLSRSLVKTKMTAWDIDPGQWELVQGIDTNGDDVADVNTTTTTIELERSGSIELAFAPGTSTVLNLKLISKEIPYWARPDLGISKDDISWEDKKLSVRIHSLGSVSTSPTTLALLDQSGRVVASVLVPRLEAPVDLWPRTTMVSIAIPSGTNVNGYSIVIDPDVKMKEITRLNNRVTL